MARTLAMQVASIGSAIVGGVLAYFLVALILPAVAKGGAGSAAAAAFLPIMGGFLILFGATALASWFWAGARRRSWFWLLDVAAGGLVLLTFAPEITFDLTHPGNAQGFMPTVIALFGSGLAIVGGLGALLDVRRGRAGWSRGGRAGWVLTGVSGIALGALATSGLGAGSPGGGASVLAAVPTTTQTLVAEGTKYLTTSYSMGSSDVLGLYVENKDSYPHSFDIDPLNIHVSVPANSTVAVAIKPTGPGTLQFYCSIPGHKDAGMVGAIEVH